MFARIIISATIATGLAAASASADVRELDQAEIRSIVGSGDGVSISEVMANVLAAVDGETMDVRAFNDEGGMCYTFLIMQANGRLATVFVDAQTGEFISPRSDRAKKIFEFSRASGGNNGKGLGATKSRGKAKGKDKEKSNNGKSKKKG